MYHTTTPDEPGWYWIADDIDDDEWTMAYWDVDSQRLSLYSPDVLVAIGYDHSRGVSLWAPMDGDGWTDVDIAGSRWVGPDVWVGPLSQPGGPFGSSIVEVDSDLHKRAKASGDAIVLEYVDYTQCPGMYHGRVITMRTCPPDVAANRKDTFA